MDYLQEFPTSIQPALQAIVIKAEIEHRLTGHGGAQTARSAALRYVTHTYCAIAAKLCNAVEAGQIPYLDLRPSLERLRHALIRDAYERSELPHWAQYEPRADYYRDFSREAFERLVARALEGAQLWGLVQLKRIELAGKYPGSPSMAAGASDLDRRLAVLQQAAQANDQQRSEGHAADGLSMAEFSALFPNWVAPPQLVLELRAELERAEAALPPIKWITSAPEPPTVLRGSSGFSLPGAARTASTPTPTPDRKTPTSAPPITAVNPPLTDRLISVQEAAQRLGVHEDTVRRMQDRGALAKRQLGRARRVVESEIAKLIEGGDYPRRRESSESA